MAAIVAIVAIVVTISFAASSNPVGATVAAITSFILLLVSIVGLIAIVIVHARAAVPDAASVAAQLRPRWSRVVPREPPGGDLLEDLKPLLREICREAHDFLEEQKRGAKNWPATYAPSRDHVRANIFLPDLSSLATSGTYEL